MDEDSRLKTTGHSCSSIYVHSCHPCIHSMHLSTLICIIGSSLSQKTLLTTYLSTYPLSLPHRIFTSIKGKLFLHNILFSILYLNFFLNIYCEQCIYYFFFLHRSVSDDFEVLLVFSSWHFDAHLF